MMKNMFSPQYRKRLQKRMMDALTNEIRTLNPELQYILADDLITALQNRLVVFHRIQAKEAPLQK
jgi:hypothetical protein